MFNQGSIELTGVSSDMAINGDGFFRISNNGTGEQMLTRDGSFRVDKEGFMTDKNGNFLLGLVGGDAANTPSVVGKIQIGLDEDVRLNAITSRSMVWAELCWMMGHASMSRHWSGDCYIEWMPMGVI